MSGEHFSGGSLPHVPEARLPLPLYEDVERNVQYACTDVTLRDPQTGKIFLGMRQTEPQLGPWFIGGRNAYGKGPQENAALQTEGDLGIKLDNYRFQHISTYSTEFPVAAPGREDHGRSTMNAVMCVDLKPEEVGVLNDKLKNGELSDEYSTAAWYDPKEIAQKQSDFPFLVKQFVRDLYGHDVMEHAIHEEAIDEDKRRETLGAGAIKAVEQESKNRAARISDLKKVGFEEKEAKILELTAGPNSMYSVIWAKTASDEFSGVDLKTFLEELIPDQGPGDFQRKRMLKGKNVTPPEVYSDNGPALRSILSAAAHAIDYDKQHDGKIFSELKPLKPTGHPGPRPEEQL